jgi:hypothetical protein
MRDQAKLSIRYGRIAGAGYCGLHRLTGDPCQHCNPQLLIRIEFSLVALAGLLLAARLLTPRHCVRRSEITFDMRCISKANLRFKFAAAKARPSLLGIVTTNRPSQKSLMQAIAKAAMTIFARRLGMNLVDRGQIEDKMDRLQFALGAPHDLMMFSAGSDRDANLRDIYIGLPQESMLSSFPGFQVIQRSDLPNSLSAVIAREGNLKSASLT